MAEPGEEGVRSKLKTAPSNAKRSFATFLVYAQDNLEKIKKSSGENKFGSLAQTLADTFKTLKDSEFKELRTKVESHPLKFPEEIADFEFQDDDDHKKRKKAKKDPNAPKRNMSAYFLYSIATRPKVKEDNPDASFGDLARLLSEQFKGLSDEDKGKWDKKAEEDKARYESEMKEYKGDQGKEDGNGGEEEPVASQD